MNNRAPCGKQNENNNSIYTVILNMLVSLRIIQNSNMTRRINVRRISSFKNCLITMYKKTKNDFYL